MGTRPSQSRITFSISPDHPALPGHFPGNPVVPGVVILDVVRRAAEPSLEPGLHITRLPQVKFVRPLLPGQEAAVDLELRGTLLQFIVSRGDEIIARGTLEFGAVTAS